jgi:hypothetical protein
LENRPRIVTTNGFWFRATIYDVDRKIVLDKLPCADVAAFDSHAEGDGPTCHPDTRGQLLSQIYEWADGPATEAIFWLNGMAGTRKSTISRTVSRAFAKKRQLGASFFFKRGDGDRGKVAKFITTIAAQLVSKKPALAAPIKEAIDADPAVVGKTMREQFEKLIIEPLSKISEGLSRISNIVIVVDALDECDRDDDVRLIIDLFSRTKVLKSPQLRVFVTSRPELPIRLGFKAIRGTYRDVVLHEIPESVVEHDIGVFLKDELAKIRRDYNDSVSEHRQLPGDWPGQSQILDLTKIANPLFIFAATICHFIADRRCSNPDKQLETIMAYQARSQESKLDATYLPVLDQLLVGLSTREKDEALKFFQVIVGSIVVLARPLSIVSLERILGIPKASIDNRLDLLHSVLSIPTSPDSPVRLLHLSFRDFLLDPEKRGTTPFWVDKKLVHEKLAEDCLRLLSKRLQMDICQLEDPGISRSVIDLQTIHRNLPPDVQYACQYWVYHLEQAEVCLRDGSQVHEFLNCHFLYWIEALSLIGKAWDSIAIIESLQSLLSSEVCPYILYL